MSILCNYCAVDGIRRMAAAAQPAPHIVTWTPAPIHTFPNGYDIHAHPADYTPPTRQPGNWSLSGDELDIPPIGDWWVAWVPELPTECCCKILVVELPEDSTPA